MLKKPKVSGYADGPECEAEGAIRITAPSCVNEASITHHHVSERVRVRQTRLINDMLISSTCH